MERSDKTSTVICQFYKLISRKVSISVVKCKLMRLLSQQNQDQLAGKRVLVRGDLDVAISESGEVLEDFRLGKLIPTLQFLLEGNVKQIIIIGHLGRPQGDKGDKSNRGILKLDRVAESLSKLLGQPITKLDEVIPSIIPEDKIAMLENLRFDPREESNDLEFAKQLSGFSDLFVNDSFATCHRAHASMVGIPKFLPSYAGLQLEKEVEVLSQVMTNPKRPLVVIIGGAKLETKVSVIDNFEGHADVILVGGKIGFDSSLAGRHIGRPLQFVTEVVASEARVQKGGTTELKLPIDFIGDKKDIGPETVKNFIENIKTAGTIIWNGPLGMFEDPAYKEATENIAGAVAASTAFKVVGGGDTVEVLQKLCLLDKMDFVSTGGGAMLELLAGKELPGIKSLE